MTRLKWLLCAFLLTVSLSREAKANTISAASCNSNDVQSAINSAAEGDTVLIPSGACTWTSGVTISGKGIILQGSGSGRVIAIDDGSTSLTIGTGSETTTIANYSPGFTSASISNGETLTLIASNNPDDNMTGTVTAFSAGTGSITINVTSTVGSGTFANGWLIATQPSTIIINNTTTQLFAITEDTRIDTQLSGIFMGLGTGTGGFATMNYATGGKPILIHDNFIERINVGSEGIDSITDRGVIWHNSFVYGGTTGQLFTDASIRIKIQNPATGVNDAWNHTAYWGALDTTGANVLYFESNDVHYDQGTTDCDDNCRIVVRYNLMDHAGDGGHGADSSNIGARTIELYNNTFVAGFPSDPYNLANGYLGLDRGGSYVFHDNINPQITGSYSKVDFNMTVMNVQRNAGPHPCWGQGTSGGANYPAPRQVGRGYTTGTTSTSGSQISCGSSPRNCNASTHVFSGTVDSFASIGDSEPAYIWGNSRTPTFGITDYGASECSSPDTASNYIVAGRDFIFGTKPGYSPYTYPHPLTLGQSSAGNPPASPSNLSATVE